MPRRCGEPLFPSALDLRENRGIRVSDSASYPTLGKGWSGRAKATDAFLKNCSITHNFLLEQDSTSALPRPVTH